MIPRPGTPALVHGLGRFGGGREALRFLRRRGCPVRVADKSAGADLLDVRQAIGDDGIDWQLGREDEALLDGIGCFVANPAIPDHNPLLQAARARGIAVTQELDLFLAAYPGRVLGVTGTNGKSTTSTLLYRALVRAGQDALLGGNIGNSLLGEEANWRRDQIAVVEMSSFQLERKDPAHRVHGAVFTRVCEDHVDRHGTLAAYHRAKAPLAAAAEAFVVHCAEDPVASAYPTAAAQRLRYALCEPAPSSAGLCAGFVAVRTDGGAAEPIVHRDALRLLGDFQLENVMAASAAARLCGAAPQPIGVAMATAPPLPFRLQLVATLGGVRIFDNGVSTEVDSTRSALAALRGPAAAPVRIHWVGGGKSKDGNYARVAAGTAPHLASAHLFGAAAAPLAEHLRAHCPVTEHGPLEAALEAALAAARPGDAVLWSPAFASFDQFPNFRARALRFHEWLTSRRAQTTAGG